MTRPDEQTLQATALAMIPLLSNHLQGGPKADADLMDRAFQLALTFHAAAARAAPAASPAAQVDQLGERGDWLPVPTGTGPDLRPLLRSVATVAPGLAFTGDPQQHGADVDAVARDYCTAVLFRDGDAQRRLGVQLAAMLVRAVAAIPAAPIVTPPAARPAAPPAPAPEVPRGGSVGPGQLSLPPRPLVLCPDCRSPLAACTSCGSSAWIGRPSCDGCGQPMQCSSCGIVVAVDGAGVMLSTGHVAAWQRTGACGACYLRENYPAQDPVPFHTPGAKHGNVPPNPLTDRLTGQCNGTTDGRHLLMLRVDGDREVATCGACGAR